MTNEEPASSDQDADVIVAGPPGLIASLEGGILLTGSLGFFIFIAMDIAQAQSQLGGTAGMSAIGLFLVAVTVAGVRLIWSARRAQITFRVSGGDLLLHHCFVPSRRITIWPRSTETKCVADIHTVISASGGPRWAIDRLILQFEDGEATLHADAPLARCLYEHLKEYHRQTPRRMRTSWGWVAVLAGASVVLALVIVWQIY